MKAHNYCLTLLSILFSSALTYAVEINEDKYEIYFGDFNNDGKDGDIYFHAKPFFILIHGDIATPILINDEKGFAYYEEGNGQAHPLNIDEALLENYKKAISDIDYTLADYNGDGQVDIKIESPDGLHQITFHGSASQDISSTAITSTAKPNANIQYQYDPLGRLIDVNDSQNGNRKYQYDKAGNRKSVD